MYRAFIHQRKRKMSASNENDSDDEDSKPLVSFAFSSEFINLQQVIQVFLSLLYITLINLLPSQPIQLH